VTSCEADVLLVSSSCASAAAFARAVTGNTPVNFGVSTWTNAITAA